MIVIDNGSGTTVVGFAGDNTPSSIFPSIIGTSTDSKESYVGHEAQSKRDTLALLYPMERGKITNNEEMIKIWHQAYFNELHVKSEEHPVLLTEPLLTLGYERTFYAESMFEIYNVPAMYLVYSSSLSLYSAGKTTGCVVDSGDGTTNTLCIYKGYVLPHTVRSIDTAGCDISDYLAKILAERNSSYTINDRVIAREIKEKYGYVALDYEKEINNTSSNISKPYELPDGQIIDIGNECFRAPEALFNHSLLGNERFRVAEPPFKSFFGGPESNGIHEATINSIMDCDTDIRDGLYSNIVLAGGTTMFPGFAERMQKEISVLAPSSTKPCISAPPNRHYSAWVGGSILASSSHFQNLCVTKQEYDEHGAFIVNRKCYGQL
ncbi:gamma-actin [Cunninghamella echinulata]|nr:gamma-actin [Cunninghamella echinulata]